MSDNQQAPDNGATTPAHAGGPPNREPLHTEATLTTAEHDELVQLRAEVARLTHELEVGGHNKRRDFVAEANRLLAAKNAEISRLREDKERLDWLEASHYLVDFINEDIEPTSNGEFICTDGSISETGPTLRAAIDAARVALAGKETKP